MGWSGTVDGKKDGRQPIGLVLTLLFGSEFNRDAWDCCLHLFMLRSHRSQNESATVAAVFAIPVPPIYAIFESRVDFFHASRKLRDPGVWHWQQQQTRSPLSQCSMVGFQKRITLRPLLLIFIPVQLASPQLKQRVQM